MFAARPTYDPKLAFEFVSNSLPKIVQAAGEGESTKVPLNDNGDLL